MPLRQPRRAGMLLATGQTTQYNSELDDGYYEKGLAKSYTILTLGQYAGTVNVDLIHYTAATIAFAATTPGTITDSANLLAQFKDADVIVITGAAEAANNGVFNVSTGNVAGTIRTTEATVTEAAGASVSIAKREAISNNCVLDNNTGLMWARYQGTKQGTGSNGAMPWTGVLYDIFQFAAMANAALSGGYADWRIANWNELVSIIAWQTSKKRPDATAFPSWPSAIFWQAATDPDDATESVWLDLNTVGGQFAGSLAKTFAFCCALVRGG